MTNFGPRCPALHPALWPPSRCWRADGHDGTHRNVSGDAWGEPVDYADGGVTAAVIEAEDPFYREARIRYWHDRAKKAERALADVHERDETVARLEGRLIEAEADVALEAEEKRHAATMRNCNALQARAIKAEFARDDARALAEVGLTEKNTEKENTMEHCDFCETDVESVTTGKSGVSICADCRGEADVEVAR